MKKKVGVIGAGPSGLVTIKELLSQGIDPICFESQETFGGAFRPILKGGRSYDNLKLTVSNYFMAYSDFMPDPGTERRYWKVVEYRKYLDDYVERFDLKKHILFSHEVTHADIDGHQVLVQVKNDKKKSSTYHVDHLIICGGSNFTPFTPTFDQQEGFEGKILHSSNYPGAAAFRGKRVVCIGLGESGADIVHEISQVTQCEVLVRDYPNVIPRWINGFTNDAYTAFAFYKMGARGIDFFMKIKAFYYLRFKKNMTTGERLVQEWIYKRKTFIGKFLTKSDIFIEDIIQKRLILKKDEVKSLTRDTILTTNGDQIKADVILCNTGYQTSLDSFSFGSDFENPRRLFKHMIHPEYGDKVCIVGWARPTQGGLPACSEMQSRYIAMLISEKKSLPSIDRMEATISKDAAYYEKVFKDSKRINSLISYHDFMNDMAKLIGCKPNFLKGKNLRLLPKYLFGSQLPSFYRINDVSPNENTKSSITSLPIAYSWRRRMVIFFVIIFCKPILGLINLKEMAVQSKV
ncbi:NAD(P)-binding domain-containing protein [Ekhidna sp.]|jgi:hypothetical protein|uniref:flavin-containing monooxygenase n=1 Tax=Ekhidna sp. TaxID=2608089 RepID=UPI0032EEA681